MAKIFFFLNLLSCSMYRHPFEMDLYHDCQFCVKLSHTWIMLFNRVFRKLTKLAILTSETTWKQKIPVAKSTLACFVSQSSVLMWHIRVFLKLTKWAILTSETFYDVKKIHWQNVTAGGNRTQAASDSKSNTIISTLTWHVLLRRSLNFCSCATWFLDFKENQ